MRKPLLTLLIGFSLVNAASAQHDVHFSMFPTSPVFLNPAMAGASESDLRVALNHRSQWNGFSSGFTSSMFSVDKAFKLPERQFGQGFAGAGLTAYTDNAGITGFTNTHIKASGSYAIDMGGTAEEPNFIAAGFDVGFLQRSLDLTSATWESQWIGSGFSSELPSGEDASGSLSENVIDLGVGFLWYRSLDPSSRLVMGLSMGHANRPRYDVLRLEEDRVYRRYTFTTMLAINKPGSSVTYWPSLIYINQGPNEMLSLGGEIEFLVQERTEYTNFKNNLSLQGGAYYRYQEAVYFVGRVNYYDFSLGISYDVTVSSLRTASNGNGAVEIFASYRPRFSGPGTQRQKLRKSDGL